VISLKNKYGFIVALCLMLFGVFSPITAHASVPSNTFTNMIEYKFSFTSSNVAYNYTWYAGSNAPIVADPITTVNSCLISKCTSTGVIYGYREDLKSGVAYTSNSFSTPFGGVNVNNATLNGTMTVVNILGSNTYSDGSTVQKEGYVAPTTSINLGDITTYPVGTVKIVQPKQQSLFDNGVTNLIDVTVMGKMPIAINDTKFSGISENTWVSNAITAPILNSGKMYINGKEDTLGTLLNKGSSVLGDDYGVTVMGNIDQWKKAGYYCFTYKFQYSPTLSKSVDTLTFGVSALTGWTSGYFIDDSSYTYYSDDLKCSIDTYIDNNKDGIDDVTGKDLTNLNDNSSSVESTINSTSSISDVFKFYEQKIYDSLVGTIKTPFTMLESALTLGDTYLAKLTAILAPVVANFNQLLTFIPDDILTCIWAIIACRLTWTAIRAFIAMITKR
jgi:hypothetical protein